MSPAETLARRYFDNVRAKDAAAVAGCFAPDGVLNLPNGAQLAGRAAIEAMYRGIFARGTPNPQVVAVISQGERCVAEIRATQPNGKTLPFADVFTLDGNGAVAELTIYATTSA